MYPQRGMYPLPRETPSLLRQEPLFDGKPAPTGTLFVLGEDGGYGVAPARGRRLIVGRNSDDVHVAVGTGDGYVSREHATLTCATHGSTTRWTLRNGGLLPIRLPEAAALLQEHETEMSTGYTPLYIQGARLHVVEVLVSTGRGEAGTPRPHTVTNRMGWPLTSRERLVLVAMYQTVLHRAHDAHPLSWNETSRALNEVPGERGWTDRKAENVVDGLRRKLAAAGVDGVMAETSHSDAIKLNLLRYLLDTATLVPPDLRLLDTGLDGPVS